MKRLTIGADACTETLALLITMAWADGRLDDNEKAGVLAAAEVFNLTKELRERLDQILQKPMPVEELLVENLSARDKAFAFVAAVWMSGVDSEVDEKEKQLLVKAAELLGLSPARKTELELIARDLEPLDRGEGSGRRRSSLCSRPSHSASRAAASSKWPSSDRLAFFAQKMSLGGSSVRMGSHASRPPSPEPHRPVAEARGATRGSERPAANAPVQRGAATRKWLLGAAGVTLVLVVAGLLAFGPLVRSRVAKEGDRRRVDVTIGSVRPGFFAVGLKDVHVRLRGVDGIEVRLDDVRINLTAGLSVKEVAAHGGELKVDGEPEDVVDRLRTFQKAGGPAATASPEKGKHLPISADGLGLAWKMPSEGDITGSAIESRAMRTGFGLHVGSSRRRTSAHRSRWLAARSSSARTTRCDACRQLRSRSAKSRMSPRRLQPSRAPRPRASLLRRRCRRRRP